MLDSIYTSLSGMQAYETALATISNNVANMNTPGFKLSTSLFQDLVNQSGAAIGDPAFQNQTTGGGVTASQSVLSFQQGTFQSTGNGLDAAIDGEGFFVVDKNGQTLYTRDGEFEFNQDGVLVETTSQAQVMVSTATSAQGSYNLNADRVYPPKATTTVNLSGSLENNPAAAPGTPVTYTLSSISVFDSSGTQQTLSAQFTQDATNPLQWSVSILDAASNVLGTGNIVFNADGTPATGSSTITATVTPTTGAPAFPVTFDFGAPGTFAGVTDTSGTQSSQLQVLKQDGVALGTVTQFSFDTKGDLTFTYSNGQTKNVATLLLARFDSPSQIKEVGAAQFVTVGTQQPVLGSALSNGFGSVTGGSIEMSNVDLTNQFTDLIIVQQGFQGSSQITSAANQMMQQLIAMGNK